MKTYVEFVSSKFPPYEGEEDKINPGIYGKCLAEFLFEGLKGKGFKPQEPYTEDWGWVVPIENDSFRLWIGCANYPEYENGFLCFIEPNQPVIKKFLIFGNISTVERVTALQKAMDDLLSSEPSITEKRWSTHEEFNNPNG